jgi:hypothetical protein
MRTATHKGEDNRNALPKCGRGDPFGLNDFFGALTRWLSRHPLPPGEGLVVSLGVFMRAPNAQAMENRAAARPFASARLHAGTIAKRVLARVHWWWHGERFRSMELPS